MCREGHQNGAGMAATISPDQGTLVKKGPPNCVYLIIMVSAGFAGRALDSVIAPLVPEHYEELHVSQAWFGMTMAAYPLAMLMSSFVMPALIACCGRVPVFCSGLLLQGCSAFLFAYADDISGGLGVHVYAAIAVNMLARIGCGMGCGCSNTAMFAMLSDRFPGALGRVMALNGAASGLSYSAGPVIGDMLRQVGGYKTPFQVLGLAILLNLPFALMLTGRPTSSEESHTTAQPKTKTTQNMIKALKAGILMPAITLALGKAVFGYLMSTLSLHFKQDVGIPEQWVGLFFTALSITFGATGLVVGTLADWYGALHVQTTGAIFSGLIGAIFLGPVTSLMQPGSATYFTYEAVGLLLMGMTLAATLIPSLPAMKAASGLAADAIVCVVAWFTIFQQLGEVVGSLAGPPLVDALSFTGGMLLLSLLILLHGCGAVWWMYCRTRGRDSQASQAGDAARDVVNESVMQDASQGSQLGERLV